MGTNILFSHPFNMAFKIEQQHHLLHINSSVLHYYSASFDVFLILE